MGAWARMTTKFVRSHTCLASESFTLQSFGLLSKYLAHRPHFIITENGTEASFTDVFKALLDSVMNLLDSVVSFMPLNDQESLVNLARTAVITMYSDLDKF